MPQSDTLDTGTVAVDQIILSQMIDCPAPPPSSLVRGYLQCPLNTHQHTVISLSGLNGLITQQPFY